MIDLEKEREEFENVYHVDGAHYEKQGGYYSTPQDPNDDGFEVEYRWDAWLERAELAQQEITELKAKLDKYESDDVVLLPRLPTMPMLIKGRHSVERLLNMPQLENLYKAMIESGEIK